MIAVLTDYGSDRTGEFTQVVGREIANPEQLAETQVAVRVPAGLYARVITEGEGPEAIVGGWRQVWAAEDKGELRRAYRTDFELWPASGSPEIFVSIES